MYGTQMTSKSMGSFLWFPSAITLLILTCLGVFVLGCSSETVAPTGEEPAGGDQSVLAASAKEETVVQPAKVVASSGRKKAAEKSLDSKKGKAAEDSKVNATEDPIGINDGTETASSGANGSVGQNTFSLGFHALGVPFQAGVSKDENRIVYSSGSTEQQESSTEGSASSSPSPQGSDVIATFNILGITVTVNGKTFHRRTTPIKALGIHREVTQYLRSLSDGTRVEMCTTVVTENWERVRTDSGNIIERKVSEVIQPNKQRVVFYWR